MRVKPRIEELLLYGHVVVLDVVPVMDKFGQVGSHSAKQDRARNHTSQPRIRMITKLLVIRKLGDVDDEASGLEYDGRTSIVAFDTSILSCVIRVNTVDSKRC